MSKDAKRNYNVYFNTHTVSGIVICVILYIIFFAGAFSLFRDEIRAWEFNNTANAETEKIKKIDYDQIIANVKEEGHQLYGRDISIGTRGNNYSFRASASFDSVNIKNNKRISLSIDKTTLFPVKRTRAKVKKEDIKKNLSGFDNIIYRLHYLRQLGFGSSYGIRIAGFVSILFLFAIITGLIVQWKKIIEFFYTFRIRGSLKRMWKDSHIALGILSTPFQFMYALTGIIFCVFTLTISNPVADFLFDGDKTVRSKIINQLPYEQLEPIGEAKELKKVNPIVAKVYKEEESFNERRLSISIENFGDKNAVLNVFLRKDEDKKVMVGRGTYVYKIADAKLLHSTTIEESPYLATVNRVFRVLHYGSFGGVFTRIVYFVLALICCWVFVSGVMIWLGDRKDSKKISPKRQRFNNEVIFIYLAVVFGLHLAVAYGFILAKILPFDTLNIGRAKDPNYIHTRKDLMSVLFFTFWLFSSVFLYLLKDNYRVFKISLWSFGLLGMLVPVLNGAIDGQWIWVSFMNNQVDVLFIDVIWLCISMFSMYLGAKIKEDSLPKRKVKVVAELKKA